MKGEERKRKDKEWRKDSVNIGKEEIKLSLYEGNMDIYSISKWNLLKLIKEEFRRVTYLKSQYIVSISCSVVSNSLQHHGLWPSSLLHPWNSPGKNTGVDCHSLLQRNFPTQGSNPGVLPRRQIHYHLSYREVSDSLTAELLEKPKMNSYRWKYTQPYILDPNPYLGNF